MGVKVTILGGGHGAHTMAADLALRGFKVTLYEMPEYSNNIGKLFETGTVKAEGAINGTAKLDLVTNNIEEALNGAKYINIVTPGFAHDDYAKLLKGKIKKDQVLIIYPGNFGALVFKKS